jgi:acylphosphatase
MLAKLLPFVVASIAILLMLSRRLPSDLAQPVRNLIHINFPFTSRIAKGPVAFASSSMSHGLGPSLAAVDFEVHGRVQGVFFRAFTGDKARQLGLVGWVRNTNAGTVQGSAQGPADKLEEFKVSEGTHWMQPCFSIELQLLFP